MSVEMCQHHIYKHLYECIDMKEGVNSLYIAHWVILMLLNSLDTDNKNLGKLLIFPLTLWHHIDISPKSVPQITN